jgi:hypothetical protein
MSLTHSSLRRKHHDECSISLFELVAAPLLLCCTAGVRRSGIQSKRRQQLEQTEEQCARAQLRELQTLSLTWFDSASCEKARELGGGGGELACARLHF